MGLLTTRFLFHLDPTSHDQHAFVCDNAVRIAHQTQFRDRNYLVRRNEPPEQREGHGLGAAADLVHRSHAGRASGPASAALDRLEAPRQQIGQHLEDALGEADAPG